MGNEILCNEPAVFFIIGIVKSNFKLFILAQLRISFLFFVKPIFTAGRFIGNVQNMKFCTGLTVKVVFAYNIFRFKAVIR